MTDVAKSVANEVRSHAMRRSDLAARILTRIEADEQAARAGTPGPWEWQPEEDTGTDQGSWLTTVPMIGPLPGPEWQHSRYETVLSGWGHDWCGLHVKDADAAHIATWDPARVLATCAALRQIVERHIPDDGGSNQPTCLTCVEFHADLDCQNEPWPCPTLRAVASIWGES